MRSYDSTRTRLMPTLAALATLFMGAAANADTIMRRMFFPVRAAEYSRPQDSIMFFVFWTTAFFFVLLMGLMVLFVFKYRRMPGKAQQVSVSHNTPLELTWSGVPLILLGIMFFWGARLFIEMRTPPTDSMTINVTAQKWSWSWEYEGGITSIETTPLADKESPVFAVPVGRPVRLVMQSTDVIHSLYVPAFRDKVDVFPNRYTTYWFVATEPGDYPLFCAEYCGDEHAQMMALVKVMTETDYDAWLAKQADTSGIPLVELGAKLFFTGGCNACHSVDGSPKTGPTWQGVWMQTHTMTSGERVVVDENYIRESILNPGVKIVTGYPNQMPTFQGRFSERELRAIIAYIASLSADGASDVQQMMEADEAEKATQEAAEQPAT